jgi:hypothetical protein
MTSGKVRHEVGVNIDATAYVWVERGAGLAVR